MSTLEELERDYNSKLSILKLSPSEASQVELKKVKGLLRLHKKTNKEIRGNELNPSYGAYPPPTDIPLSQSDSDFTLSFCISDEANAKAFFDDWGFVVFDDVLSSAQCARTVTEICELQNLNVDDPKTWSSNRYGLPDDPAIFSEQILSNRQEPALFAAISNILGTENILVSHDRYCVYPPTHNETSNKTENPPLHLDICPWSYSGKRSDPENDAERLDYEHSYDFREEMNKVVSEWECVKVQARKKRRIWGNHL